MPHFLRIYSRGFKWYEPDQIGGSLFSMVYWVLYHKCYVPISFAWILDEPLPLNSHGGDIDPHSITSSVFVHKKFIFVIKENLNFALMLSLIQDKHVQLIIIKNMSKFLIMEY